MKTAIGPKENKQVGDGYRLRPVVNHASRSEVRQKEQQMTIANGIKKLSNYGRVVKPCSGTYEITIGRYVVGFIANGKDEPDNNLTCAHIRRQGDHSNPMTDYHAEQYFDNLSQAIACARQQATATDRSRSEVRQKRRRMI